ncbi:MAG: DUF5711 family protein [Acutalibacteraceae bacterium]
MTDENNKINPSKTNPDKKEKEKNAKKSAAVLLVLVVLIVAITFFIANSDGIFSEQETTTKINVVDVNEGENSVSPQSSSTLDKGFPVSFKSGVIENAMSANSCVFVLTHDALTCISATGKITFTYALSFSDPSIKCSDNYAIVYDRQGSEFYVFNTKGLYFEGQSDEEGKILTACVSNSGKAIIASRRTGSSSALAVYDKDKGSIFAWSCAKEHILSIDITKNEKNLACAAIGSTGGEIYTRCYVFDLVNKKSVLGRTFKSSAPTDCIIESSNFHLVCTDKSIMFDYTDKDSTAVTVDFSSTIIKRACDDNGNVAVLTKKVDSFGDNEVSYYDSDNKLVYSYTVSDKVCDLKISGSDVCVLTTSQLLIINSKGNISKEIDIESASDGLVVDSRRYYRYYLGVLYLI